jgi:hypothetical protein
MLIEEIPLSGVKTPMLLVFTGLYLIIFEVTSC